MAALLSGVPPGPAPAEPRARLGAPHPWHDAVIVDDRTLLAQLRAAPRRAVIDPSPADLATARAAYDAAIQAWTAASPHNRELIDKVTAALATLRKNGN